MKLINITNGHAQLVNQQLSATDAKLVKVYSLGQSTVIYSEAPTHKNIVIINKKRPIKEVEIDFVIQRTIRLPKEELEILRVHNFVEISHTIRTGRPKFVSLYSD
ncbi:DUF1827 family protein [Atopobacter sp. AH10]|uniref:DUF1827 family protein n=1 Tax=Atopobacter sp. AH10 TaxID=2315861 RepID=UPI000EF20A65|nr:DUF1827 family protein [Atopobacter sp. AH10]RLK62919.1 DUF1827 family protein [Atopobacter sp. AH10]